MVTTTNAALIRKYDLTERSPVQSEHDYCDSPNIASISEYKKAALLYIAGYVAKTVKKQLLCIDCCKVLLSSENHTPASCFLEMKDRGKLHKPTQSVIQVCKETEKCFQRMLATTDGKLPHGRGIPDAIAVSVLGALKVSSLFTELDDHMYDSAVDDSHVYGLIKSIVKCYCKVRLYHLGKEATQDFCGKNIRKKLSSKLVLFNHQ